VTQTLDLLAETNETPSLSVDDQQTGTALADPDLEEDEGVDREVFSTLSSGRPMDRRLETALDDWKLKYQMREIPIAKIVRGETAQIRMPANRAPKDRVQEYLTQLNNGAVFPPIVVKKHTHELIDGNTRLEAYSYAGRTTIPAYVVDAATYDMCRQLGVFQNQQNGQRLTQAEQFQWARNALARNMRPEIIARISALSIETVRRLSQERAFEAKATQVGLDVSTLTLPKATRAAIGHELAQLAQVKAVTEIAEDSGMSTAETRRLIRAVKDAPSEDASLEIVAAERAVRTPQIQQRASGVRQPHPTFAQQSFSHMQWLLDHTLDDMIEFKPELAIKQAEMARKLCDHICGLATKVEAYVASIPSETASGQPHDSAT